MMYMIVNINIEAKASTLRHFDNIIAISTTSALLYHSLMCYFRSIVKKRTFLVLTESWKSHQKKTEQTKSHMFGGHHVHIYHITKILTIYNQE